jgi:hypothetical protein
MRAEDPWLVARYSPMMIDDNIYFVIAVGLPSGNLRRNKSPQLVTYVDPRTGAEYTREKEDFMVRAAYATLDQVQNILDYLKPYNYKAVQVMAQHRDAIPITLVVRSYPDARGPVLNYTDRALIHNYGAALDPHDPANSIVVAARLLEEPTATKFMRLTNILAKTIWSV